MTCDEIRDLLPAYALDALAADELAAVDSHLALPSCDHSHELDELRAGVAIVEASVPAREPPSRLRSAVLEQVGASPRASRAVARAAPELAPRRVEERQPWFPRWRWAVPAYAAAAVLLLVVGGFTGWTLAQDDDEASVVTVRQVGGPDEAGARLVYDTANAVAVVTAHGLAPLSSDRVYQFWVIHPGAAPISLGLLEREDAPVVLPVELADGDVIAITEEPAGGSDQPTTAPLVVVEL